MPYFDVRLKDPEIENYPYYPCPRCNIIFEFYSRNTFVRHLENHGVINIWSLQEERLRELFRNPMKIKKLLNERQIQEKLLLV